jgi:SAM-dependent methyltransferase
MGGDSYTDRAALRERFYAGPDKLAARQRLWASRTGESFIAAALDLAELTGDEAILDAGCGNGVYETELRRRRHRGRVVALDLSLGMRPTVVGDIANLPFPDQAFDIVLAMHMLYHVPSIPKAVAELRRVLKHGGTLLAATNGHRHVQEIHRLVDHAAEAVAGRPRTRRQLSFTLENGAAQLEAAFADVRRIELPKAVPVTKEVVVDYIASVEPENCGVEPGAQHEAFMNEVRATTNVTEVTSHVGLFIAK